MSIDLANEYIKHLLSQSDEMNSNTLAHYSVTLSNASIECVCTSQREIAAANMLRELALSSTSVYLH